MGSPSRDSDCASDFVYWCVVGPKQTLADLLAFHLSSSALLQSRCGSCTHISFASRRNRSDLAILSQRSTGTSAADRLLCRSGHRSLPDSFDAGNVVGLCPFSFGE